MSHENIDTAREIDRPRWKLTLTAGKLDFDSTSVSVTSCAEKLT